MAGGLNLLPHKSWNPYGWKQRQRVALDEEKAEAAAKEGAKARSDEAFDALRSRKNKVSGEGVVSGSGRPAGHVNLFAEEERALDAAARRDAETAKTLDESHRLGGRAMRDAPWYAQRPKRNSDEMLVLNDGDDAPELSRRRPGADENTATRGSKERKPSGETTPVAKRRKPSINELRQERVQREADERKRARETVRWE